MVVGGGPTGVEVAGALAELFSAVLRKDFPDLHDAAARVVLVEMADHLLDPFSEPSRRHAHDTLRARGVEVRLGTAVQRVEPPGCAWHREEVLRSHTLIWAAGVRANALADALGVATGRGGRIVVGADLAIPGHADAFAVGDIAEIKGDDGTGLAQVAPSGDPGRQACRRPDPPPRRRRADHAVPLPRQGDHGHDGPAGRRGRAPQGLRLRGTLGWLAWLGLHIVYLIGFRNRLSVLLNWAWNYITWDRGPRLIVTKD